MAWTMHLTFSFWYRPNAPSNNMWQMDNLRRTLQDAEDAETAADSLSNGGGRHGRPNTAQMGHMPLRLEEMGSLTSPWNQFLAVGSTHPHQQGMGDVSGNGAWPPSGSNGATPVEALASSNGARPIGSLSGAEPGASGASTQGRESWQTRGLFREEDSDEAKGPGPGYVGPSMNGASTSSRQNGAGSSQSSTQQSADAAHPAGSETAPSSSGRAAGSQGQKGGLQQQRKQTSHQLAWDSADQEFDDAASVMNFLR